MTAPAPSQLRLPLETPPALGADDFVVDAFNAEPLRRVNAWRTWPGGALALAGPEGAGKSHLARAWLHEAGAVALPPGEPVPADGRPVLLEDADRAHFADEALFHLLNRAAQGAGALLLTGRTAPAQWPCALPDLRSRLNALPVAELGEPSAPLLRAVLVKFFRERGVRPGPGLLDYLLLRIERSVPAARAMVERLEAHACDHRMGLALARAVLGEAVAATRD